MNIHVQILTPTEEEAHNRRMAFRRHITERATRLAKPTAVAPASKPTAKVAMPCGLPLSYFVVPEATVSPNETKIMFASRIRQIQDLICEAFKLRRADILSARRNRELVMARQIAMYLCKVHTPNSFPDLGRRFGYRDHTTVLCAVRRVEATMALPMGTSASPQWSVSACDLMRKVVNAAEATIATWGNDRTSRVRHPSRSVREIAR